MSSPFLLRRRKANPYFWFAAPGLLILIATIGGSLLFNLGYSFTRWSGYGRATFTGLRNYGQIFQNEEVRRAVLHAIYYILPFAVLPTIIGCFLAAVLVDYITPRFGEGIASFFRSTFYLPQIVPMAMTGIIFQWFLSDQQGIVNTYLRENGLERYAIDWQTHPFAMQVIFSLALIWIQMGFTLIIFISGMARMDQRILEAAQLDGASWFQVFRKMTIPMIRPEIAVVFLTTTISAIKIFAPVYWITGGGPNGATSAPSTFVFDQFYGGSYIGLACAIATLFALVLGLIAYAILRYQRRVGLIEE